MNGAMLGRVQARSVCRLPVRCRRSALDQGLRALGVPRRRASRASGRVAASAGAAAACSTGAPPATAASIAASADGSTRSIASCLARIAVGVVRVERRLLEEVLAQQAAGAEHDALGRARACRCRGAGRSRAAAPRAGAARAPRRVLLPVGGDLAPEPAAEVVERVAAVPVDRGEVALAGERRVERPERARQAQRVLGDRLGEVAARRRDGADDRHRARRDRSDRGSGPRRRARRTRARRVDR